MTTETARDIRTIGFETITGEPETLAGIDAKAALIVNVASECGYTKQYAGLQELYNRYAEKGLTVIGFPANNFGGQEPGENAEIQEFCSIEFGVTFPMMAKVSVKGDDQHPLFAELTKQADPSGDIGWNFHKFLVSSDGEVLARFESGVEPLSDELVNAVEEAL